MSEALCMTLHDAFNAAIYVAGFGVAVIYAWLAYAGYATSRYTPRHKKGHARHEAS